MIELNLKNILDKLYENPNSGERLSLLEELYWAEYKTSMTTNELDKLKKILLSSNSIEEYAAILKLYSNPEGAFLDFYQEVILSLYVQDPLLFMESVAEYPDESLNVLYIFRNSGFFEDFESEKSMLIESVKDEKIKDNIFFFFKMYENLCQT